MTDQIELEILLKTIADTRGAAQTTQAVRQAQQAAQATGGAAASTGKLGSAFEQSSVSALKFSGALIGVQSGLTLVHQAAQAAGEVVGSVVQTYVKFSGEVANVAAVSGASASQLKVLSEAARSSGIDIGIGSVEGAQGLSELAKAGISTQDALGGALRATELMAKAGGVTLPQAAEISSGALNSFGLSAGQLARVADLVAGSANASAISVEDFRQSLSQVSAVANTVGVSFDDTAVAIAELGQAGIKGSDAGTSLRTFLLSLTPASQQAADELRTLGIVTAQGTNQFFDATGKAKSFAEISQVLKVALAGYNEQQKIAALQTIFGTDAIRAASVFTRQGAAGFDQLAAAINKISATEVAKTRLNSLSGDLEKLQAQAEATAVALAKTHDQELRGGARAAIGALQGAAGNDVSLGIADVIEAAIAGAVFKAVNAPDSSRQRFLEGIGLAKPLLAAPGGPVSSTATGFAGGNDSTGAPLNAEETLRAADNLAIVKSEQAAVIAAAPKFGQFWGGNNEQLRNTHRTLSQIAQDIADAESQSGSLTSILSALSPNDTAGRSAVAAAQDLLRVDAQINAQRSAAALAADRQREQEATKITDPRDAAGAGAARERLRILDEIQPRQDALTQAQKTQSDLQDAVTASQGQEAQALLGVLSQRQEIARLERDIADQVDRQLQLRQEQTRLLAQQRAIAPNNALDDTQAAIQRAQLELRIRGLDSSTRIADRTTIRTLTRNALPSQELAAFDANRGVTLAQRPETATQISTRLNQIPLEGRSAALATASRSGEDRVLAAQEQTERLQALSNFNQAVVTDTQRQVDALIASAATPTKIQLSIDVNNGSETQTIDQLLEANGQVQVPPAIKLSAVRR